MPRRFLRRPLSRAAKLTKEWISWYSANDVTGDFTIVTLAPGAVWARWILDPASAAATFDIPTLMRTIFWPQVSFNAIAGSTATNVRYGLYVCGETGAGPTQLDPWNDGWMSNFLNVGHYTYQATPAVGGAALPTYTIPHDGIDVKTKRKLTGGNGLAIIFVNDPVSNGSATISVAGRTLVAH